MKIKKLYLNNFKSFGPHTQGVNFNEITTIIGANSTGKTSLITALLRLFGQKKTERNLIKQDFHIPSDMSHNEIHELELKLEAQIEFPELLDKDVDELESIPNYIKQLIVEQPGEVPYIRIRLEGRWIESQHPEGEIEQKVSYITVPYGDDDEDAMHPMPLHHKSLIQMIYVPAMRDANVQLRNATGSLLWRIFKNIKWPEDIDNSIEESMSPTIDLFNEVEDIKKIKLILNEEWKKYHRDSRFNNTDVIFNSTNLNTILKNTEISFSPDESNGSTNINNLGDGLKSLFYITMVAALLEIEKDINFENKTLLNILAVEEPENHISPHLLGRVVKNLKDISHNSNAQVVMSSHSSSIVKRISPENIRYMRITKGGSLVNSIELPEKTNEAYTYIKEAVQSYPELYFSKLVILGEGDSEEIVIPKLLSAFDISPDDTSISIVPLGGRHVNHLWKLLNHLSIPHVTLLDLDRERGGGGWKRIKYVLNQLHKNDRLTENLLTVLKGEERRKYIYTIEEVQEFPKIKGNNARNMDVWIKKLERVNVFFSYPLDIDFSMLKSFEDEYKNTMSRGPNIIKDDEKKYEKKLCSSIRATLKSDEAIAETYSDKEKELMIWYNSLFLGRGKPTTHIKALLNLDSDELVSNAPKELLRLGQKVEDLIK